MNEKTEHIDLESLRAYREGQITGEQRADVETHIATCERCRALYMTLGTIENCLRQSFERGAITDSCPEDWEVGAVILNELPDSESGRIEEHIKSCDHCIGRAAEYYKAKQAERIPVQAPEAWKQHALRTIAKTEEKVEDRESIFQQIASFLTQITTPLPALPGYAIAAVVIIVLIVWNVMPQKERIITVAATEKITVRDSEMPSSFGFSGVGETRDARGMEIVVVNDTVVFRWKAIDGASSYEFVLRDRAGKTIVSQISSSDTQAKVIRKLILKDRLYEWVITGKTGDGRYFEYTGEVLMTK